jgi:putative SOS response-associated peptidase YedK
MRRTFRTVNPLLNLEPSWNVAPTQMAPVVRRHPETGERYLDLLQWGLLPYFTKDPVRARRPINARAETVATSGMFGRALERRHCIVPADAVYEWRVVEGGKQPYAIARHDGQPMAFAGLCEGFRWPDGNVTRSFTIITTNAGRDVVELHERMPVILEPADWAAWLGEAEGDPASLLHPSPTGTLRVWLVDRRVNSPQNNGPELLETDGRRKGGTET